MLARIEAAVKDFPKAAMFELYERGYTSLFEQLISCIISIRTMDETTIPVSLRLFEKVRTPAALIKLGRDNIADLLYGSTFPGQKPIRCWPLLPLQKNIRSSLPIMSCSQL